MSRGEAPVMRGSKTPLGRMDGRPDASSGSELWRPSKSAISAITPGANAAACPGHAPTCETGATSGGKADSRTPSVERGGGGISFGAGHSPVRLEPPASEGGATAIAFGAAIPSEGDVGGPNGSGGKADSRTPSVERGGGGISFGAGHAAERDAGAPGISVAPAIAPVCGSAAGQAPVCDAGAGHAPACDAGAGHAPACDAGGRAISGGNADSRTPSVDRGGGGMSFGAGQAADLDAGAPGIAVDSTAAPVCASAAGHAATGVGGAGGASGADAGDRQSCVWDSGGRSQLDGSSANDGAGSGGAAGIGAVAIGAAPFVASGRMLGERTAIGAGSSSPGSNGSPKSYAPTGAIGAGAGAGGLPGSGGGGFAPAGSGGFTPAGSGGFTPAGSGGFAGRGGAARGAPGAGRGATGAGGGVGAAGRNTIPEPGFWSAGLLMPSNVARAVGTLGGATRDDGRCSRSSPVVSFRSRISAPSATTRRAHS